MPMYHGFGQPRRVSIKRTDSESRAFEIKDEWSCYRGSFIPPTPPETFGWKSKVSGSGKCVVETVMKISGLRRVFRVYKHNPSTGLYDCHTSKTVVFYRMMHDA